MKSEQELIDSLVHWIREMVVQAGARGVVVGLSGGIDSAVVAALCNRAFPGNTLGVLMPCGSSGIDEIDAVLVAEALEIPYKKVNLDETYDTMVRALGPEQSPEEAHMAYANIKPRLRMTALYFEAGVRSYLVAGTGNRSEIEIGYYTKYGDGGVDMEPIGALVKTQVRQLATALNIPEKIIDKAPTAGLWDQQTDEEEMGFTYAQLDRYLVHGEAEADVRERIEHLMKTSEHKRNMPPVCPLD